MKFEGLCLAIDEPPGDPMDGSPGSWSGNSDSGSLVAPVNGDRPGRAKPGRSRPEFMAAYPTRP